MSQFLLASFEKREKKRGVSVYCRVASTSTLNIDLASPLVLRISVGINFIYY
jgi:hypothetical protein